MSASVVPARAGMSPTPVDDQNAPAGGPRASGDEPDPGEVFRQRREWSPRERG